ncbi:hypothetical protein C3F00_001690 [Pseudomonas sp. MWU13-2860]|nr:hypothetical protein C3F00_001690 [Pseudomonas sp. MWU13-2860]
MSGFFIVSNFAIPRCLGHISSLFVKVSLCLDRNLLGCSLPVLLSGGEGCLVAWLILPSQGVGYNDGDNGDGTKAIDVLAIRNRRMAGGMLLWRRTSW